MNRVFSIWACLFGASAVLCGAFGAHTLKAMLNPVSMDAFRTAVWYQFFHALLLLGIGQMNTSDKYSLWAGRMAVFGIICFSGSIYFLSTISLHQWPVQWMGPITPIGGISFFISWICLLGHIINKK